jgi:hypothetical protein
MAEKMAEKRVRPSVASMGQ